MLPPPLDAVDDRPFLGLVVRPGSDVADVVHAIESWGAGHGKPLVDLSRAIPDDGAATEGVEDARACSLVFALGGDGTVLRALALAAPAGTPVFGVNFGRLGFLTEVAAEQLEPALRLIDERRATIEDRAALRAELITARGLLGSYAAYNDAVLSRTPGGGPAAVAVQVQGTLFARYACDAVLISTATGSTAYNFAAGGPLVAPQVNAVVVTPVAPHGPFNRSLVVDAGHEISAEVLPESTTVAVEIDGRQVATLEPGSGVRFTQAELPGRLLRVSPSTFYERTRKRLGLADPEVLRRDRKRTGTVLADVLRDAHGTPNRE